MPEVDQLSLFAFFLHDGGPVAVGLRKSRDHLKEPHALSEYGRR